MTDDPKLSHFVVAGLLILANAFISSFEFALISLRRTKIEELAREGSRAAARVKEVLANLDEYLSTVQVGITLTSLLLGWIAEDSFAALLRWLFDESGVSGVFLALGAQAADGKVILAHTVATAIAFLFVTLLHVVMGELVPKILTLRMPETVAMYASWPMKAFNRTFYPLVWLTNATTQVVLRCLGIKSTQRHTRVHSVEEIAMLLDESHHAGVVSPETRRMLQRVFQFHNKVVKEIMVPRPDIVALDVRATEQEIVKVFSESGYSRVPVFQGNLDRIVGIVYVKDLLYTMQHPHLIKLVDLLREPLEVPESCPVSTLLRDFQKKHVHMAIVVDEFGATAGLVTLEDVIEEIVGEIRDEHDQEPEEVEKLPDGTVLIEGHTHVDRFKEVFPEVELPEGNFDTVGGLLLQVAGKVPREGDSFRLGELALRVVKRDGRRIKKVAARRVAPGFTAYFGAVPPPEDKPTPEKPPGEGDSPAT